jgi:hypothetical protein
MLTKPIALILVASLVGSGCASAGTTRVISAHTAPQEVRNEMIDYVQRLPVGSRVRVDRTTGRTIHGTLMAADPEAVIVQRATRIPEAPISIPVRDIARIQIEERSNLAKAIIIGAAAGAGATLGVLFLIAAAFAD